MRQPEDTKTLELLSEPKRGRGRPRVENPMTPAERQRRSRRMRRSGDDGEYSLSSMVSSDAFFALSRLAAHFGLNRQQMLENLILDRQAFVLDRLKVDMPEWDAFFNRDKSQKLL
ncbi:hypothetical protein [Paraherbaspirillum soli]|uniref:Uncharacterized protein n=1 Tax=Paraherbaspirillum soli TaxID=631222 RepID=A0ABW0MEN6_9BURK